MGCEYAIIVLLEDKRSSHMGNRKPIMPEIARGGIETNGLRLRTLRTRQKENDM